MDDVPCEHARLRVKEYYQFFKDAHDRVWVITDFPEEPGCWIPELGYWCIESQVDDELEGIKEK
jgi:hypothetical protein